MLTGIPSATHITTSKGGRRPEGSENRIGRRPFAGIVENMKHWPQEEAQLFWRVHFRDVLMSCFMWFLAPSVWIQASCWKITDSSNFHSPYIDNTKQTKCHIFHRFLTIQLHQYYCCALTPPLHHLLAFECLNPTCCSFVAKLLHILYIALDISTC